MKEYHCSSCEVSFQQSPPFIRLFDWCMAQEASTGAEQSLIAKLHYLQHWGVLSHRARCCICWSTASRGCSHQALQATPAAAAAPINHRITDSLRKRTPSPTLTHPHYAHQSTSLSAPSPLLFNTWICTVWISNKSCYWRTQSSSCLAAGWQCGESTSLWANVEEKKWQSI